MNAPLDDLAQRYWDLRLETTPSVAPIQGDFRFCGAIEDWTAEHEAATRSRLADLLDGATALDADELSLSERVTAGLLRAELSDEIESIDLRTIELDSNQMTGPHAMYLQLPPQTDLPRSGVRRPGARSLPADARCARRAHATLPRRSRRWSDAGPALDRAVADAARRVPRHRTRRGRVPVGGRSSRLGRRERVAHGAGRRNRPGGPAGLRSIPRPDARRAAPGGARRRARRPVPPGGRGGAVRGGDPAPHLADLGR